MGYYSRRFLVKEYTSDATVITELLAYTKNKFNLEKEAPFVAQDEAYISAWNRYYEESLDTSVFGTLQSYLSQFQFPIKEGISTSPEYRDATLKGKLTENTKIAPGLLLNNPDGLVLKIHKSNAGLIPVLIVPDDEDFDAIIQALSHKNEPVAIPKTMGAALLMELNNWDRIHTLKKAWLVANPLGNWNLEFKENILPKAALYKDKLIVLSTKPYSGVKASSLGLDNRDWLRRSLDIRLEHECVHLFTLKYFGKAANNLHDELIADYIGIRKTLGFFDSAWLLHFMGLENYPNYRDGARLENYLETASISIAAFKILQRIVKNAIDTLVKFDQELNISSSEQEDAKRIATLCSVDLITMASPQGLKKLLSVHKNSNLSSELCKL